MHLFEQPHHDGSALYVSPLNPRLGDEVTLWLRVPPGRPLRQVWVRHVPDGEPRFTAATVDTGRTGRPVGGYGAGDTWWRATVTAHNRVTPYRFYLRPADGPPRWLTAAGTAEHDLPDATDFRLVSYEPPPAWAADAVVYEIFPDRFARSATAGPLDPAALPGWAVAQDWDRDDVVHTGPLTPRQVYGGDLDGIVEHLDHIERLGADTIYLRPVFPGRSNHRYDASTFDRVDPLLGGDEALRRLAGAVHTRGMRLVGDITTNHCGAGHEWFTAAAADPAALDREMFYFTPDGGYECWWDVPSLPRLNWGSPLVRERMAAVLRRWLDVYDGWRVDVANMTARRRGEDANHEVAALLRRVVADARPDATFVGEYTNDPTADLDVDGWHGAMNYGGFTRPLWTWLVGPDVDLPDFLGVPGGIPRRDGTSVLATMRAYAARMSWRSQVHSWLLLDSFDTPRIRTVAGSRERHLVALGLQMTLPGVPMICAGSEWSLTAVNGEHARTPMPWQRSAERDEELFQRYQTMVGRRRTEPALRRGGLRWWHADADTLVFARETERESLVVAVRRAAGGPVALPIDSALAGVHDAVDLMPVGGVVTLPGDGPSVKIWRARA